MRSRSLKFDRVRLTNVHLARKVQSDLHLHRRRVEKVAKSVQCEEPNYVNALRLVISISASASYEYFLFQLLLLQLPNPLLQELPLCLLWGQRQSFLIRGPSLGCPAKPAVQIRTG